MCRVVGAIWFRQIGRRENQARVGSTGIEVDSLSLVHVRRGHEQAAANNQRGPGLHCPTEPFTTVWLVHQLQGPLVCLSRVTGTRSAPASVGLSGSADGRATRAGAPVPNGSG